MIDYEEYKYLKLEREAIKNENGDTFNPVPMPEYVKNIIMNTSDKAKNNFFKKEVSRAQMAKEYKNSS